ncbi:hypothetical protein [Amycolatopsis orientalis]|uniref:hypothetical protein n=1 Tax=Amycolatopsis orientalis TaxID=31958 RepID=UPI001268680D|nr:hypothetical protein [Amycolatopsis orientalis]
MASIARVATVHWGGAAGAQVLVLGPEHAEIPGRWSVFAAAHSRGVELDALVLPVVASRRATTSARSIEARQGLRGRS